MENKNLEVKNFSNLILAAAFIFIIAVGIYLRIAFYVDNRSFWLDEAFLGINILKHSYLELFLPLEFYQVSPPLFSVVCKFFYNVFGGNQSLARGDYLLRILPFLSSIFSVPLFILICNRLFKNKYFTVISSVFFLFNIPALRYTAEFKQYSTELFVGLVAIYIFQTLFNNDISKKRAILYSIFFILSFWLSNSISFILFGGFLIILFKTIKKEISKTTFFILFIPAFISFLAFFLGYYIPNKEKTYEYMQNFWSVKDASFFTISNFYSMFGQKVSELLPFISEKIYTLYLILGIFLLTASKKHKRTILILLPIILTVIASFIQAYPFDKRLILFLLPNFIFIFCTPVFYIKENKYITAIISGILIAVGIFNLNYSINDRIDKQIYAHNRERSYARELTDILFIENPKLDNIISCGMCYNYYSYAKTKKVFCSWNDLKKFTVKSIKSKIQNTPNKKNVWILFTDSNVTDEFLDIRGILLNEYKNTKIWQSPYYYGSYLMKIER